MANSRLERLGTIYSRVTGLLRAGAMKEEEKPLWYALYEAFPPEQEPKIDRVIPNIDIKPIFYAEDKIRANFHKKQRNLVRNVKLDDSVTPSSCQQFITIYDKLKDERKEENEEHIFKEAVDILKTHILKSAEQNERSKESEKRTLVSAFAEAKQQDTVSKNVNIKDLFKE